MSSPTPRTGRRGLTWPTAGFLLAGVVVAGCLTPASAPTEPIGFAAGVTDDPQTFTFSPEARTELFRFRIDEPSAGNMLWEVEVEGGPIEKLAMWAIALVGPDDIHSWPSGGLGRFPDCDTAWARMGPAQEGLGTCHLRNDRVSTSAGVLWDDNTTSVHVLVAVHGWDRFDHASLRVEFAGARAGAVEGGRVTEGVRGIDLREWSRGEDGDTVEVSGRRVLREAGAVDHEDPEADLLLVFASGENARLTVQGGTTSSSHALQAGWSTWGASFPADGARLRYERTGSADRAQGMAVLCDCDLPPFLLAGPGWEPQGRP